MVRRERFATAGHDEVDDTLVVWSEDFLAYRWSATHPMKPIRLALTMRLAHELGVLDGVSTTAPDVAGDELLTRVHRADYIGWLEATVVYPIL